MSRPAGGVSRRRFLSTLAAASCLAVVPRSVLGGAGQASPSETFAVGVVGLLDPGGKWYVGVWIILTAAVAVALIRRAWRKTPKT